MKDKGKYDDICEYVREQTQAAGTLVIICDGNKGNGFSASFTDVGLMVSIPTILRQVADQIEKERKGVLQ